MAQLPKFDNLIDQIKYEKALQKEMEEMVERDKELLLLSRLIIISLFISTVFLFGLALYVEYSQ